MDQNQMKQSSRKASKSSMARRLLATTAICAVALISVDASANATPYASTVVTTGSANIATNGFAGTATSFNPAIYVRQNVGTTAQTATKTVTGSITGAAVGIGLVTATPTGVSLGVNSSGTVSSNNLSATGLGDSSTTATTGVTGISLATIGSNGTKNGIAALIDQSVLGAATHGTIIDGTANTNNIGNNAVVSSNVGIGPLKESGNAINAAAEGNVSLASFSGAIPSSYTSSGVAGSIGISNAGNVTGQGNIVASTFQFNMTTPGNADSYASASNNNVIQSLGLSSPTATASGAYTLTQDKNGIQSVYSGNGAATSVPLASAGPSVDGSAIITSVQSNVPISTNGPGDSSSASNNSIVNKISPNSTDTAISLNGGNLTQASNTISAIAYGNTTSVTGNAAAKGASGGVSGNIISLASGTGFQGASATASNSVAIGSSNSPTTNASKVKADLGIGSYQVNYAQSGANYLGANATKNDIGSSLRSTTNSVVEVSNNTIASHVVGNGSTNEINAAGSSSGALAANVSGGIAINNVQQNIGFETQSSNSSNAISVAANGPVVTGSTLSLAGNGFAATDRANQTSNIVVVGATHVGLLGVDVAKLSGAISGTAPVITTLSATAGGSINNVQTNNASATATGSNNSIQLGANGTSFNNNTLTLAGPANGLASEALVLGDQANNAASVTGTTLSGSAGVLNSQNDAGASSANLTAQEATISVVSANAAANSQITLGGSKSGNTFLAESYGNQASNSIAANVGTLTVASVPPSLGTSSNGNPTSNYAIGQFALLSQQTALAGSESTVDNASSTPFNISVVSGLTNTKLANGSNQIAAQTFGNSANNTDSVTIGAAAAGTNTFVVPIGTVSNSQILGGKGSYKATVTGNKNESFVATVTGPATAESNISVSGNTSLAQVVGNQASNSLSANGTSIFDVAKATPVDNNVSAYSAGGQSYVTQSTFSVNNTQSSSENATATQGATGALASVGGSLTDSSLSANGNSFSALAYNNTASNSLNLGTSKSPITAFAGSSAAVNTQLVKAGVSTTAQVGVASTIPATSASLNSIEFTAAGALNIGTNAVSVTGSSIILNFATPTQASAFFGDLTSTGGASLYGISVTLNVGTYHLAFPITGTYSNSVTAATTSTPVTSPVFGVPAQTILSPSVVEATVGTTIAGSTIGLNNNIFKASGVGNTASTLQTVSATTLNGGIDVGSQAFGEINAGTPQATADFSSVNGQTVNGPVTATTSGKVVISGGGANGISTATLSASSNAATAQAIGNNATTGLTLNVGGNSLTTPATTNPVAPATYAATGAVVSAQVDSSSINASSGSTNKTTNNYGLVISSPLASSNSSISLNNNVNAATAEANVATNALTVSGNILQANNTTPGTAVAGTNASGNADPQATYVVLNDQLANGSNVTATAFSKISNPGTSTAGLVKGNVTVKGNATTARAISNLSTNTLSVTGNSTLSATTALQNIQTNGATVVANAMSNTQLTLNGGTTTSPASTAAIDVLNNTTSAVAAGNAVTNVLNVSAGAQYGAGVDHGANAGLSSEAPYAVLNSQSNTASVTAQATQNPTYAVALNNGTGGPAISNTSVVINGNSVSAAAYGNSASEAINMSALNGSAAGAALVNSQSNVGNVTASATNVGMTLTQRGAAGMAGTTMTVGGNSIGAMAVGNSSVVTVTGK